MSIIDRYSGCLRVFLSLSIVIIHLIFYIANPNSLILASMIESSFDVITSLSITFFMYIASKPEDENHPYGHWKFENLGSVLIGIFFLFPAYDVIKENLKLLITGVVPVISMCNLWMVGIVMIPTVLMILLENRESKRTGSDLTEINYIHFLGDFLKILSVGVTIIILHYLSIWWLPYLTSAGIMAFVLVSIIPKIKDSVNSLTDHEASEYVYDIIHKVTAGYKVDNIKTRTSGPIVFIEFDLDLEDNISISDSKIISSSMESNIKNSIPNSRIIIRTK